MTETRAIADIQIGKRHRKDMGDLPALAESIRAEGLLQPVGITGAGELVFGERRLAACRDLLGWARDPGVGVVAVSSIAAGEYRRERAARGFHAERAGGDFGDDRTREARSRPPFGG